MSTPALLTTAAAPAVPAQPLALPRLWPGFAQVMGQLAGRSGPAAVGGASARWQVLAAPPAGWSEAIALRLRWQGHQAELSLDAAAQAWCLGEAVPADTPRAWRHVLLADRLHDGAHALLGGAPEWEEVTAPWPRDPNVLWCAVGAASGGGTARLRWATGEAWAAFSLALARHPAAEQPKGARPARRDLGLIPLRLELGRTRLDRAALRDVAPGDIVVVDEWRPRSGAIGVQLYAGRRGELQWPAEVRQDRLTVLSLSEPPEVTMNAHPAATLAPSTPGAGQPAMPAAAPPRPAARAEQVADERLPVQRLDRLEVTLHFDLGGLALSLHALEQVAAGQVLQLPQPLQQCEVGILCQDRLIGKGQLVAVGERLGVRVTEFAVAGDAAPA